MTWLTIPNQGRELFFTNAAILDVWRGAASVSRKKSSKVFVTESIFIEFRTVFSENRVKLVRVLWFFKKFCHCFCRAVFRSKTYCFGLWSISEKYVPYTGFYIKWKSYLIIWMCVFKNLLYFITHQNVVFCANASPYHCPVFLNE